MSKALKYTAVLFAAIFLFSVSLSAAAVAEHSEHDCSGEGCEICLRLSECISLLTGAAAAVASAAAAAVIICVRRTEARKTRRSERCSTLLALKTMLLN